MNKKVLRVIGLLSLACCPILDATSELRSPLNLYRGVIHYPLSHQDECPWVVNTWDAFYGRCANDTFINCCANTCAPATFNFNNCGKSTTKTQPLAALFFGSANFRGEQAFAGGLINNAVAPSCVPALSFSTLSPRFTYNEQGAIWGIKFYKKFGCNNNWRAGMRASIPFKVINTQCENCCTLEEDFSNVVAERQNNALAGTDKIEYAYRLDFLSTLCLPQGTSNTPLVTYQTNGVGIAGLTQGANIDVVLRKRLDGTLPSAPFASSDVGATNLNPDGLNGTNNELMRFTNADYLNGGLAQNRVAQGQVYVVPRTVGNVLDPEAIVIRNVVDSVLNILDFSGADSAQNFFARQCIFFCANQRTVGLGDLDTELYAGYHPQHWYTDLIFGIRFPTGTRNNDPKILLYQTTGNNKHFEIKGAVEGGWHPNNWFALRAYAAGAYVCPRTETRAAPFAGQTIKNIGPNINVKLSYSYFLGNLDLNFFHPYDANLGWVIGYELYAKGRDKVKPCVACLPTNCQFTCPGDRICPTTVINSTGTVNDLLGVAQPLDFNIIGLGTNVLTNKIRGEIFYRWRYFELFGGASQVVAGRNSMKETEAHVGITVNF